jgi:hypothetical protein
MAWAWFGHFRPSGVCAGVWVFGGGLAEDVDPVIVAGDGTITAGI